MKPRSNPQVIRFAVIACFLALLGVIGCATPREIDQEVYSDFDPAEFLSSLPSNELAAIKTYSTNISTPRSNQFAANPEAEASYSEWYKAGYAYAYVTGSHWLYPPQLRRKNEDNESLSETAKHVGWFSGNSDGYLAGLKKHLFGEKE